MSKLGKQIGVAICLTLGWAVGCDDGPTTVGNAPNTSGTAGEASSTAGGGGGGTGGATGVAGNAQGGAQLDGGGQDTAGQGTGGAVGGGGGTVAAPLTTPNYQLTGSWPERPVALETQPGTLSYTKITVHADYLAESCAIADYNNDGLPDISSGRRWYEHTPAVDAGATPSFVEHVFRIGHDQLPRSGATEELSTGVSDDCADFAWDMDSDGWMDIINVSNPAFPQTWQPGGTAFWYQNPGEAASDAATWQLHSMHDDFRHEQHSLLDVDGDGRPEITGGCSHCPQQQKRLGYYQQEDWSTPEGKWTFHAATSEVPFNGEAGWLHGLGAGDVNGDGKPDILERNGVWLQQADGTFAPDLCPGVGCIQTTLYSGADTSYYGGAQMYAFDADGDGDQDIVSVDMAHSHGLAWYEQTSGMAFTKHYIAGTPVDAGSSGVSLIAPHAVELVDMDGDGIRDIVTGSYYMDLPPSYAFVPPPIEPVLYVFRTVRDGSNASGSVTFEPTLVDDASGVALQLATGHINTDGIPDICVSNKLGLFVFLGR